MKAVSTAGPGVKLPKDWISEHASASVGQLAWPKNKKEPATSEQQAWQQLWEMVGLINERHIMDNEQLKRIADILEEILRIIKKDMGIKWLNIKI